MTENLEEKSEEIINYNLDIINYKLDMMDRKSLDHIKEILDSHYHIMNRLNEDSMESLRGGAMISYEVEIKLKERWD